MLATQVLVTAQVPDVRERHPGHDRGDAARRRRATSRPRRTPRSRARSSRRRGRDPTGGWSPPDWVMYAGVGAVGLGLVALLVMLVPSAPGPVGVVDRVASYTRRPGAGIAASRPGRRGRWRPPAQAGGRGRGAATQPRASTPGSPTGSRAPAATSSRPSGCCCTSRSWSSARCGGPAPRPGQRGRRAALPGARHRRPLVLPRASARSRRRKKRSTPRCPTPSS